VHGSFVDEMAFNNIKKLTCLLPGIAVTVLEQAIVYTVPVSQVVRPIIKNGQYTILSEMDGSLVEPRVAKLEYRLPATYKLSSTADTRSVDRVTIYHEEIEKGLLLIPHAKYSDAKLYTRRTTVTHEGWGRQWTFHFREVYYYPMENDTDPHLYFTGQPRYEIEVVTDEWVEDTIVLDVLRTNLNAIYKPILESDPAFIRKN
jgi:hypothetical protein